MKEQGKSHKSPDFEPNSPRIQRLSAAIALARPISSKKSRMLYTGWNDAGMPVITQDESHLSEQALSALSEYRPVDAPRGLWEYAKWRSTALKPVQYLGMTEPIDIKDLGRKMEKDKLTIGYTTDDSNNPEIITIDELTLLGAINNNLIVWQEINKNTLFKDEVIPTNLMFTLAIPQKIDGKRTMMFMLFNAAFENQSNEVAFQGFLMDTLKSLIYLDAQQPNSAKKGYSKAFKDIQFDLKGESYKNQSGDSYSKYGNGFLIVTLLNEIGLIDTPKTRLDEIRKASGTGGFTKQIALITLEIARNAVSSEGDTQDIVHSRYHGGLSPLTTELLQAFRYAHKNARNSFARFR